MKIMMASFTQLLGMVPPALRNTEKAVRAYLKAVAFVETPVCKNLEVLR